VRVPTSNEERERALSRQRQQILRERQRFQSIGRSLLASHGIHVTGKWWKGRTWSLIRSEAPGWVVERLEVFIRRIEPIDAEEAKLTAVVEQTGGEEKIPRGVGALTFEVLRREVGDWARFTNRRQVSNQPPAGVQPTAGRCPVTPVSVRANTAAGASGEAAASTRAATPECGPCSSKWSVA
jgi:transposase